MAHTIHIQIDPAFAARVAPARLRDAARAALKHQGAPQPGALTIRLTSDAALRALNRDFLGEDHVTDVLSFPSGDFDRESGRRYFGDIAIAYPRARAQAAQGRHPVWAELQLLVVHAVLHLLGHDHAEAGDRASMWAAQAEILRRLRTPMTGPEIEG